jgi:RHS repeat-associated protein
MSDLTTKNLRCAARALLAAAPLMLPMSGAMADDLPAFHIAAPQTLIAPGNEDVVLSSSATPVTYRTNTTAWEVEDLARALQYDPQRMYEFVRNEIDVHPLFGLQKGARGAVIDLSGTPFDQADLLVQLLRESIIHSSSVTAADYVYGTVTLNGADFTDWFGISDAQAACRVLAAGGFPARVNGLTSCASVSGTVSSVEMRHLWVQATVNGVTETYDPAFKRYEQFAGINLDVAMGYTAGAASSAATASSGTRNGVPYVTNFNTTGIENLLEARSNQLRTALESEANYDQSLEEILGGRRIIQVEGHIAGPDQPTTSPAGYSGSLWTSIPDHFRTTLTVNVVRCTGLQGNCPPDLIAETLLVDEIYGERLAVQPNGFDKVGGSIPSPTGSIQGCQATYYESNYRVALTLGDIEEIAWFDGPCDPGERDYFLFDVEANHPYAADSGTYMDGGFTDVVDLLTRAAIVTGFGDVSANYEAHMRRGLGRSRNSPWQWEQFAGDPEPEPYVPTQGTEMMRDGLGASWLSQFSQMIDLQTAVAGAHAQHHHSLGVTYARSQLSDVLEQCENGITGEPTPCLTPRRQLSISDEAVVLSVSTGVSLTLDQDNAAQKDGLDRAVAAAAATLEGSVLQQSYDTPAPTTTASRFIWANGGADQVMGISGATALEDNDYNASTGYVGGFDFFVFEPGDEALVSGLLTADGVANGSADCSGFQNEYRCNRRVVNAITDHLADGFTVLAPSDVFLGPGRRCGRWDWRQNLCERNSARGGALIAYRDDGSSDRIVHLVTHFDYAGKGAGAPVPPEEIDIPSIPTAADILENQSTVAWSFNVDGRSGQLDVSTGPLVTTGTGEFPYSLSLEMSFGSGMRGPDDDEWGHNWDVTTAISSSASEAMGGSRVVAAAPSIVAIRVMQDIYSAASGANSDRVRREVAAMGINNWWSRQMAGNVVSVTHGGTNSQFVRWLETNTFLAPAGSNATLIQTGSRYLAEPINVAVETGLGAYRPTTLVWHSDQVSFTFETPARDSIQFEHWRALYHGRGEDPNQFNPGLKQGFRATRWSFPSGMYVDFEYETASHTPCEVHPHHPDIPRCMVRLGSVVNSLGRRLDFTYMDITDRLVGATDENGRYGGGSGTGFITADGAETVYNVERYSICRSDNGQSAYSSSGLSSNHLVRCGTIAQFITSIEQPEDDPGVPTFQYNYDLDPADPLNSSWKVETGQHHRGGGSYATTTFFSAAGRESATRDPVANYFRTYFDEYGRETSSRAQWGRMSLSVYDGLGRTVEQKVRHITTSWYHPDRYDTHTTTEYDQRHNVRFERNHTRTNGAGVPYVGDALVTEYRYEDPLWPDNPTSVVDPGGDISTTTYHPTFGYPLIVSGAEGERTEYVYDANGLLIETRTAVSATEERVVAIVYDPLTQLPEYSSITGTGAPYTLRTDFDWTPEGWLEAVHAPHPSDPAQTVTMRAQHDAVGRVTRVDTADGRVQEIIQEFAYDLNGNLLTARTSGDGGVSWITSTATYSPTGRVLTVSDPDGDTSQFNYDSRDWMYEVIDPMLRRTHYTFRDTGEVQCERRAFGSSDQITYIRQDHTLTGQVGRLMSSRGDADSDCSYGDEGSQAYENHTVFTFDYYMRETGTYFPDSNTPTTFGDNLHTRVFYNADGTVDRTRNRAAQYSFFSYDRSNREDLRETPEAYYDTEYDLTGAITHIELDEGKNGTIDSRRDHDYDAFGRLERETISFTAGEAALAVEYEYDRAGNRTAIRWPDGYTARYQYNAISQLIGVCEDADGNGVCERTLASYGYDELGRIDRASLGNSATSNIYYAWQDDGDLDAIRHDFGGVIRDFAYGYNANGELNATYASDGSWMWSATGDRTINYDPANARNEMLSWTEGAVTSQAQYDANGNYQGNGVNDFAVHNSQNQMTSIVVAGQSASFRYGPMGRRIETTMSGVNNGLAVRYLHAGDMEIAELVEIGGQWKIKTRYIPGPGVDQRVAMITVNTTTGATTAREYYHADRLGNVIAMAAENGAVTANYVYTPYGVEDYGASGNPFRFTGRRWDAAVDLYYYRARYYDPELGRFLQTDPVLYADQMNLYAYVGNNPLNATDPMGECTQASAAGPNTRSTEICADPATLDVSNAGRTAITEEEGGAHLTVYKDTAGLDTVGVGHLVTPADNLTTGQTITQTQSDQLFDQDLQIAETGVEHLLNGLEVSQEEFDALADLVFNVGIGNLSATNSPGLNAAIAAGDYGRIGNELVYSRDANGNRQPGLVYRSQRRQNIFRNGDYRDPRIP